MKKDRLYDILETMKKNQLEAVLSHFGALSDHSALGRLSWAYEKGRPGRPRPPLGVGLVIVLNTVGLENSKKKKSAKKMK